MTRLGMNPARLKFSTYTPQRTTVVVLVHIPHLTGYFAERLEILKICLNSILQNTQAAHDLLVFDNGSCVEARSYLEEMQDSDSIRFLLRSSTNIGKIGALQLAFRSAPGELIAYCDDDFYLYPNWLTEQIRVFDEFPNVGMVSGYAVPTFFELDRIDRTIDFARSQPEAQMIEQASISPEVFERWAMSTGRDVKAAQEEAQQFQVHAVEYHGIRAYATAHHDQFLGPKQVLLECLPSSWSGRLMGEMVELDRLVNERGYLKLTTYQQTSQHLGNRVNLGLIPEQATEYGQRSKSRGRQSLRQRVLNSKPVRFVLLGVYSRLFHLINPE
jgi:glycosyltransferase involved in cell wall biosynthesis